MEYCFILGQYQILYWQTWWSRAHKTNDERSIRELLYAANPSVMVLTSISFHQSTPLVILDGNFTARRYISNVLEEHVVPFFEQHPDFQIFQHEEARSHSAGLTSDYIHAEKVLVMSWPAFSPDFSPIEHLWDQFGQGICARQQIHPGRSWNWLMYWQRSGVG